MCVYFVCEHMSACIYLEVCSMSQYAFVCSWEEYECVDECESLCKLVQGFVCAFLRYKMFESVCL